MSVHYKFKSALEYDTVTFDGLHISVKDLKKAILQQKKIGKTSDFDLQVTNAQTKETYTDENVLIPKNASLIVARVPLTQQQRKQWEKEKLAASTKPGETTEQNTLTQVDISSLDVSEEEKIKTMITQSTSDYDPSNYVKIRGGNQVGTVPASYICFRCHQHGHWIKDCPSALDSSNMGMTDTIKKSTGIPRSFMIEVEGPQVPGARMTPSGVYAVPAIDHEVYKEKKIEKPPFLAEKEKPAPVTAIPEDLICGICKDLLQDAVMIPCCGISFCDECIRNVLVDSEDSECPDCNEKNVSPDTMIPNRFLRNSVNTFKNKTGYVKSKPQLIQQRPPSPPRPSLPDFVPPPDYVESTSAKDNQRTTKAEPSPIYQGSPASALTIHHSPYQNQTTPLYGSEHSPFGENSNSSHPEPEASFYSQYPSYGSNLYQSTPPQSAYQRQEPYVRGPYPGFRHPAPGSGSSSVVYQNFTRPPPNFPPKSSAERFPMQSPIFPPLKPVQGQSELNSEQKNREGKEILKDSSNQQSSGVSAGSKEDAKHFDSITKTTPGGSENQNSVPKKPPGAGEKPKKDASKGEKLKRAGIDMDDVSSVSSNASEEPPPPVENRRPNEGHRAPSQGPSYAIPPLFSGQHPVILPPPGSEPYPPPRTSEPFPPSSCHDYGVGIGDRSGTPTVDERLEIPPIRPPYDPYRPPGYVVPGYDQHFGMPHPMPMPYDTNMMYDRGYRGVPRGPRIHRGRYAMRQPPPPGSRPLSPPRNEEEAYLAFQRMLKEKEERDKRKNEKLKMRRSTSRSRSRSGTRSRRSFSGPRSRSRTRSRTPPRRSRSRSKKRSRTRSRSFVMSRSRSRSYSRSPLHERNYSPKKYYSPHRSPLRYDRYDVNYGQWSQDYRRGRYRGRGVRGRFYKNSPSRGHEHQSYNRYRDENYVSTSPKHYRSPSRYYDQRLSPRSDYPRDSREREYRSYDREIDSAARNRSTRRSHSNSLPRNQYESERERDRDRDRDKGRERDRERPRGRENEYRNLSRSRRSRSRRYTPPRKISQERSDKTKDLSPERRKDWDKEKDDRHRSRERRSYDGDKDKRKNSRERDRSKDYDRDSKKHDRSRSRSRDKSRHDKDRSRSKDKKKRSLSWDKQKSNENVSKKRRSSSRRRSISVSKDKDRSRSLESRNSKDRHKKRSESTEKEKRSVSKQRDEVARSASREKTSEQLRPASPKIPDKDEEEKKEKKKDKEKKKRKKEKETEEERAARKKRKREKKEEKRRKQELKASEQKMKAQEKEENEERTVDLKNATESGIPDNSNFVSSFKTLQPESMETESIPSRMNHEDKNEYEKKLHEDPSEPSEGIEKDSKLGKGSSIVDVSTNESRKNLSVIAEEKPDEIDAETGFEDDNNVELENHASYESLLEVTGESQKKGILAPVPEISKWELDESQVTDSNPKASISDVKSPEFPVKVTREVIKRAENAIFKKAVNAIREPIKKVLDKDEKKDRKIIPTLEKDRSKEHIRAEQESDKTKRVFLTRDKDKFSRSNIEINKSKTEVKRTINSLQITIPRDNEGEADEGGAKNKPNQIQRKTHASSKSPPTVRVPVKERLGSKIEKHSSHVVRTVEKRSRSTVQKYSYQDEKSKKERARSAENRFGAVRRRACKETWVSTKSDPPEWRINKPKNEEELKASRKDYQKPALSSTIGSMDTKRSSIDEAHFVPNYDESSDEEENVKSRISKEKELKSGGSGESKKRPRSSSDSSVESTKKHKKKRSKSKKKKSKKSKKHVSDSSDSSDSERERKKHKKSKKKKKSKH